MKLRQLTENEYDDLDNNDNICINLKYHGRDLTVTCHDVAVIIENGKIIEDNDDIFNDLTKEINLDYVPSLKQFIEYFPNHWSNLLQENIDWTGIEVGHVANYAITILHKRWPEAEQFILSDVLSAYRYARDVYGRWPEAEKLLVKHPEIACNYAMYVICGRWPAAEPNIMHDATTASSYARFILKSRWRKAENVIITNPHAACDYACDVMHKRWPKAEPVIIKDPSAAYYYATKVIKHRWLEAEDTIMGDAYYWNLYRDSFRLF